MRKFILLCTVITAAAALTCYNGMKLLRMQNVGTTTTECDEGAMCYNMTTSAYLVVDVIKAGCSKWRCMLAKNQCISTYFELIPVSLCCCSHDRCNVGGNPVYDSNPQSITGGNGGGSGSGSGYNYNYGGGSGGNNQNQGGSGYDYNYGSGGSSNTNNQNRGGSSYDYNYGSSGTGSGSSGQNAGGRKFTPKEVEDKFRGVDIDHKGDQSGGDVEETFQKVDAWTTPPPLSRGGAAAGSKARQGANAEQGKEIEI